MSDDRIFETYIRVKPNDLTIPDVLNNAGWGRCYQDRRDICLMVTFVDSPPLDLSLKSSYDIPNARMITTKNIECKCSYRPLSHGTKMLKVRAFKMESLSSTSMSKACDELVFNDPRYAPFSELECGTRMILGAISQSGRYLWDSTGWKPKALPKLIQDGIITFREMNGIFAVYMPLIAEHKGFILIPRKA